MAAADAPPPPLLLATRARGGCALLQGPGQWARTPWGSEQTDHLVFDTVGNAVATYGRAAGRAEVWDPNTGELLLGVELPKAINIALSPKGTFLVVWKSPAMEGRDPNCFVYTVRGGGELTRIWAPQWPCVLWAPDESTATLHLPTHIAIHAALDQAPVATVDGWWTDCSQSHSVPPCLCLAAVPPEKQRAERPTQVRALRINKPDKVLLQHELNLDSAEMLWNRKGTACILNASLDFDVTGRSYYGEATCFLFQLQDKKVVPIATARQAIHDVSWNTKGDEFVVVYGRMPDNKATIFNEKGAPVHNFAIQPRNTVSWSPHSRLLALAGFGNLPGDVEIWDRNKLDQGERARVGSFRVSSITRHQWSPDSRYLVCATCHPRMTTANKVTVFKHNGEQVYSEPFEEVYDASFVPRLPKCYPQREPSPPPRGAAAPKPAAKAAVFRAAGSRQGGDLAAQVKAQMSASQTRGGGYSGVSSRVGATAFDDWRGRDGGGRGGIPGAVPGAEDEDEKKKKKKKEKPAVTAGEAVEQAPVEDFTQKSYPDVGKALQNARKKLQGTAALRGKDPATLQKDQLTRVAQHANQKAEVAYLQDLQSKGVASQP